MWDTVSSMDMKSPIANSLLIDLGRRLILIYINGHGYQSQTCNPLPAHEHITILKFALFLIFLRYA